MFFVACSRGLAPTATRCRPSGNESQARIHNGRPPVKGVQASCPACGGPVRFKVSSALVTVCEFCRTVVARTDRAIEDLGKVAAIVETDSPLQLGLKGTFRGK